MAVTEETKTKVANIKARIRKMTGGKAETLEGGLRVAFERIEELEQRLNMFGSQTLSDIPEGTEIDPHLRGKIEP